MDNPTAFITALIHLIVSEMPLILSLIFGGCCRQLITLGQFGFVAIEGLLQHMTWGKKGPKLKPRVVPISNWFLLVTLFFIVSVLNNLALGYNISIPLHIIFRSGGLIINMLLGTLFLKKRYSVGQITGILLVTVGVICATLNYDNIASDNNDQTDFSVGIILLVIAMFLSAGMGLFQEVLYQKYGKQWREGLFYTHFLALPLFIFFYKDLFHQAVLYNSSP
ncbi:UAA transporter, partial [Backusella circina FSU 941]